MSRLDNPDRTSYVLAMPTVARDENLVTYAEAAGILDVSVRTVHRLREDGTLEPIVKRTPRNGSHVRFLRAQVEAIAAQTAGAA